MDSSTATKHREKLEAWLRYYDDLGVGVFYKDQARVGEPVPQSNAKAPAPEFEQILRVQASPASAVPAERSNPTRLAASRTPTPSTAPALPVVNEDSLFEAVDRVENDTLERIREDLGECTRCRLHKKRNSIVFGVGNPRAELVFVGEGPGHDEDVQGLPFVGRAGKLLTQMIEAMGLRREDVYICNVVKCRPPENRRPEDDEVATCSPYLYRQLSVIRPKAIVCLGATAAQSLLKTKESISRYRGQWLDYRGTKLMVTYHPAYLLRNPAAKGDVWKDLQKVMAHLGLAPRKPARP